MEVELKLRLQEGQVDHVRQVLAEHGACAGREDQVDTYFAHPCRDLVATDEALRLRKTSTRTELTYKGPRQAGDLKARPETNLEVAGEAAVLLESLGFQAVARLSKTRERWALPGVEVAIDFVEGLGWFVELEALEPEGAEATIHSARHTLQLDAAPVVQHSYLGLGLDADAAGVQRL